MSVEVRVPELPESVADATLLDWNKNVGDFVAQGENMVDLETDKVVLELPAPVSGIAPAQEVAQAVQETAPTTEKAPAAQSTPAVSTPAATATPVASPAAKKLIAETGVAPAVASGKGGRVTKQDVLATLAGGGAPLRAEERVPMTRLRKRVAERLLDAQSSAALLTTFNEINMKPIMDLRAKYKDQFEKKHDTRLGFMSFFVKAATEAQIILQ